MSEPQISKITVILHWLLAVSVFYLFVSSWWMLALPLPSDQFTYRVIPFQLHKNMGMTLLFFIVVMLAIRIVDTHSQQRVDHSWSKKLADFDHLLLYFLVAASCLSGYLSSSYSGWETTLWWLVDLPAWTEENDDLNILFSDIHSWSCWALLAVISLHITAAIYHAFSNDSLLRKMFRWQ